MLDEYGWGYVKLKGELKYLEAGTEDTIKFMEDWLKAIEELKKKGTVSGGGGETYYTIIAPDGTRYSGTSASGLANWYYSNATKSDADKIRKAGTYHAATGPQKMATGGYTGEWSNGSNIDNGRLAFLHQKELVLNEHDTENFLTALEILRQLELSTFSAANGLFDLEGFGNSQRFVNTYDEDGHLVASGGWRMDIAGEA